MWSFRRIDPVAALSDKKYITFVGSGGKTTFMEYIAEASLKRGRSVAITTTTKIYAKEPYVLLSKEGLDYQEKGRFVRVGKTQWEGKLTGVEFGEIEQLGAFFDVVLIEADGSKGKPLKYPAPYEPVIPPFSDRIYVMCGLDGLFGRVDEAVFRWEIFAEAAKVKRDTCITPEMFLTFFSDRALLKHIDVSKCAIVLNKYDALTQREMGSTLGKALIRSTGAPTVIISSLFLKVFYALEEYHEGFDLEETHKSA